MIHGFMIQNTMQVSMTERPDSCGRPLFLCSEQKSLLQQKNKSTRMEQIKNTEQNLWDGCLASKDLCHTVQ